jgi:S1-C subfamily serine protease
MKKENLRHIGLLCLILMATVSIAAQERQNDLLIGIWATNMCGKPVVLKVALNDENAKSSFAGYKYKAVLLNGREVGYGFKDGDDWFYLSPMATPGVYEGKTIYRNRLFKKWFPTRILVSDVNAFTAYDDPTVQTCGGSTHVYFRKEPRNEPKGQPQVKTIYTGTGFLLWDSALVLTANHVVEDGSEITVRFPSGSEYSATVLNRDANNDIAILKLKGFTEKQSGFQLDVGTPIQAGETVHALGYPLSSALGTQPSIVSGQISSPVGYRGSPTEFRMTTPINHGNSGGPILNEEGKVIGIAVSGYRPREQDQVEGVTFGIKMTAAVPLLQQAGVKLAAKLEKQSFTPSQIFSKFVKDVVLIEAK